MSFQIKIIDILVQKYLLQDTKWMFYTERLQEGDTQNSYLKGTLYLTMIF